MSKDQRSEATVESDEKTVAEEQPTLQSAVLAEMGVKPKEEVAPPKEEKPAETTPASETEVGEVTDGVVPPAEGEDAKPEEESQSDEPEAEAAEPEESAEEEKVECQEEWTPEQRAQIIDARKRARKWKETAAEVAAREQQALQAVQYWQAQAQQLNAQLQQKVVTPTEVNPLADVFDMQKLAAVKRQADEMLAFAELGIAEPETAQNVLLGGNAQGEEVRASYKPKELVDMKMKALRWKELVPAREALLKKQALANKEALELYPQLNTDPEWNQRARALINRMPEIRNEPDYLIWVGHALAGENLLRQQRSGNGQKKKLGDVVKQLKEQPKFKAAPSIPKARSPVASDATSNSRIEAATKAFKEKPTEENRLAYFAAKLGGPAPEHEEALV